MANASAGGASTPSHYSLPSQPAQSYYGGPSSASDHGYPDYAAYAAYAGQYPRTSSSPTNASFPPQQQQTLGMPGRDFRHPSPGPSLGQSQNSFNGHTPTDPSVSGSSSNNAGGVIPSSKEREAMAARRVANPDGSSSGTGPVMQHMDGGRLDATPEDEEPSEVPPRYDTIPHDR